MGQNWAEQPRLLHLEEPHSGHLLRRPERLGAGQPTSTAGRRRVRGIGRLPREARSSAWPPKKPVPPWAAGQGLRFVWQALLGGVRPKWGGTLCAAPLKLSSSWVKEVRNTEDYSNSFCSRLTLQFIYKVCCGELWKSWFKLPGHKTLPSQETFCQRHLHDSGV